MFMLSLHKPLSFPVIAGLIHQKKTAGGKRLAVFFVCFAYCASRQVLMQLVKAV